VVSSTGIRHRSIVFLGFAFDEENIKTLQLNRAANGKRIHAIRYGMTPTAWEQAKAFLD
jgi:hypothetical protein